MATETLPQAAAPTLPRWLVALTVVVVLLNLLPFGVFSMVHPELPWPVLGEGEARFPIQFFAARHIAFGVVLLHGLIGRDLTVLRTCYTLFFVLAVLDFGLLATHEGYSVPVAQTLFGPLPRPATLALSLGLFVVPMGACMAWLRRAARAG